MLHLVINLKENLIQRKQNVMEKISDLNKDLDRNFILIYSGEILEIDFLINCLNDMINYVEQTKKINK